MRKVFCFTVLFTAINCLSQSYKTTFIDQPVITINCESFVIISDFKKIESSYSSLLFQIKSGGLYISVSGIIDKASSSNIMISLYAMESLDNEMIIIASKDSQRVQYKVEGSGSGSYRGYLNNDDNYIVNTQFKIIAPGHPAYFLVLPLNVQISNAGNHNLVRCFIDGTAYVFNAEKKRNKKKKQETGISNQPH